MEKILQNNKWSTVYEITEPSMEFKPYIIIELGVKFCPNCKHAYCMRFRNYFKCESCGFEKTIKTPNSIKITNYWAGWVADFGYALAPVLFMFGIGLITLIAMVIKYF